MLTFKPYIEALIARYEKAHPDVDITWVDVPFAEGEKRAITSMLARKTPDVINLNPDFSAILASRGTILDINQWVSLRQKASFIPAAWQGASLGSMTLGIPWYLTSAVTLYNQDLLRQADEPLPPRTYPDLDRLSRTMRERTTGYAVMPILAEGGRFFRLLRQTGVRLWGDDNHLVFANNRADEVLTFWVKLFQDGRIPMETLTEGQQAAVDRYQSGTLALLLTGPNFLNIVRQNAPEVFKTTGVASQFPEGGQVDFSEMILVVPRHSRHPREAVEFALFVANPENTLELSRLAPVLPPHKALLQSQSFLQPSVTDLPAVARRISAKQLLNAHDAMRLHPMQSRLNQLMDFYVQQALLGKMTPKAAMQKAQAEMNRLLS
jgi:putative chitobiose transport system substrate-binding protein